MDRVTQLQEALDKTVADFAQAILALSNEVPPKAEEEEKPGQARPAVIQSTSHSFFQSIQNLTLLVDNLPGIELSEQAQLARLRELDRANSAADAELEEAIMEADELLAGLGSTTGILQKNG
ncbi:uncharacterized protein EV422DRAFT_571825 [Fimicolochytrium jonesii]|uniref:uncharacterized protein n=1 Tax=Fimicolochytrium jonesii TaxID=1396493 RepID=UPI0022FDC6ED|nr:uncharacterized protein EV422DRAFT_571825 [Fimicolochytrium jonesii]KAI8816438.1 hypothetical protein EV422DRAFT_571825 [Fimicolochytrium jonesii]